MIEKIQRIKAEIEALKVSKSEDLENIRIKYLSKKGEISQLFNDFRTVAAEQKREVGKQLNELKTLATEPMPPPARTQATLQNSIHINFNEPIRILRGNVHRSQRTFVNL